MWPYSILVGSREERRGEKQIYFRSHIFLFSFPRRRCLAIMLKAVNRRTIGLTCAFVLRFFVILSRARSDHPFWIPTPVALAYKLRTLKLFNELCRIFIAFLFYPWFAIPWHFLVAIIFFTYNYLLEIIVVECAHTHIHTHTSFIYNISKINERIALNSQIKY